MFQDALYIFSSCKTIARWLKNVRKSLPRRSQDVPRGSQDALKTSQEAPKTLLRVPKSLTGRSKRLPQAPKSSQKAAKVLPRDPKKAPTAFPNGFQEPVETAPSILSKAFQFHFSYLALLASALPTIHSSKPRSHWSVQASDHPNCRGG